MKSRKLKIILIATLLLGILLSGCSTNNSTWQELPEGYGRKDMSAYTLLNDSEHVFIAPKNLSTVIEDLTDPNTTALFYIGYPTCPFCTQAVPLMNEVAKSENVYIRVIDASAEDFSEEIYQATLDAFEGTSVLEDGDLFVPQLIAVKDGKVVGNHLSLTDDYNTSQSSMTAEQRKVVADAYLNLIKLVK